ncbi:MAG: glycosyltransferase [Candidatus Dadabacteria bacterium]|nr:MAG: glycosyltransferase [Candidatus Dadabacteria bacterium]
MRAKPSSISFVLPCYNEEEVLPVLYDKLKETADSLKIPYEIVFVDDGSSDSTWTKLAELARRDSHIRAVKLSRNFGHQTALTCGVDKACGEVVVIMDADLQDPPELVVDMVAKWQEGYDVVYGKRTGREGEGALKRFFAFCFYRVFKNILKIPLPEDAGDFRLIDKKVADALRSLRERHRLIRALVVWIGFRQAAVEFRRPARAAGETKYPFKKSLLLALDAITSFSLAPVRLVLFLGLLLFLIGVLMLIVSFFSSLSYVYTVLFLLAGVQLMAVGVVGEYVGKTFEQVKERPLYFISEEIGSSKKAFSAPAEK